MEFEEIAKKAYNRDGIDEFWNLPTKYAYIRLEELYYKYKLGNIDKEKSIIKKQKIEKEYNWNLKQYEDALQVHKTYNENRIENELLLSKIEKAENKNEIFKPAFEIIANCIKDDSFVKRNMEKISKLDF